MTKYVELHYVSTKINPMFKDRVVPYQWFHVVDARRAARWRTEAMKKWPDVTVTIRPYRGNSE